MVISSLETSSLVLLFDGGSLQDDLHKFFLLIFKLTSLEPFHFFIIDLLRFSEGGLETAES